MWINKERTQVMDERELNQQQECTEVWCRLINCPNGGLFFGAPYLHVYAPLPFPHCSLIPSLLLPLRPPLVYSVLVSRKSYKETLLLLMHTDSPLSVHLYINHLFGHAYVT